MNKLKPSKKSPPSLAGHRRHIKRRPPPASSKPLEEGYELRRERELSYRIFVTLSPESNDGPVKVNIVKTKASLGESAPLMPSDKVTHKHLIWLTSEGVENLYILRITDSRPANKGADVLPRQQPWNDDVLGIKERFDVAPRKQGAIKRLRRIGVALREVFRQPCVPRLALWKRLMLALGHFAAKLTRSSCLCYYCVPEIGTLEDALAATIAKANLSKKL